MLNQLNVYGVDNQEFKWCHSYLCSTKQVLHLGGKESCETSVK